MSLFNKISGRSGLLKGVTVAVYLKRDKDCEAVMRLLSSLNATPLVLSELPSSKPLEFQTRFPQVEIVVCNYATAAELQQCYTRLGLVFLLSKAELVAHTDRLVAAKSLLKRPLANFDDAKPMKKPRVSAQKGTLSDPMEVDDDDDMPGSRTSSSPLGSSTTIASSSGAAVVSALPSSSSSSSSSPSSTSLGTLTAPSASIARSDGLGRRAPALASIFAQTKRTAPSPSVVLSTSPSISAATLNVAPSSPSSIPALTSSGAGAPATSSTSSTSRNAPSRPRNAFAGFFSKTAALRSAPTVDGTDALPVPSSSSTPPAPSEQQSTSRPQPRLQALGKQRRHDNAAFFGSVVSGIPQSLIAADEIPAYLELSASGPTLRVAFVATNFGDGAHLLSQWSTYQNWGHPAECLEMAKAILALNFDGLCQDLNDAVTAIVEQDLFVEGPTLLRKTLEHSEGKKHLEIPVNVQIPLDLPATYIRLFYLRPDKVHILQEHLVETAPKLSARIRGVISDGAHFIWNGNSWVAHRYTGTTERSVLERVAEVSERCLSDVWERAVKDNVVHRTVVAVVSTAGPRPVSRSAQFMAELALLVKLGPRNRINAIDQTQRPVYALPIEFIQAWHKFTADHPEIWTHLSNLHFNLDSPPLRSNSRESHTEYLLRFVCFQLGITRRHAVQCYDLAPNLTSNGANDAYMRLDSEAGARGFYNSNPSLAAAVRSHLARPNSSHVLFGERCRMMAGIVFSTLKVPLPLSRRVSRMRPSHNHTLNITASSGQATNVSVSFAHHPGMSTHTGNADIGFGAYMSMVVGIACGAIAAYDPALISAFRATINGMSFIKAMVEDDALYSCDHRGCSHVAPTKKALNYHKNGHGSKEAPSCDGCGHPFAAPSLLTKHQEQNTCKPYVLGAPRSYTLKTSADYRDAATTEWSHQLFELKAREFPMFRDRLTMLRFYGVHLEGWPLDQQFPKLSVTTFEEAKDIYHRLTGRPSLEAPLVWEIVEDEERFEDLQAAFAQLPSLHNAISPSTYQPRAPGNAKCDNSGRGCRWTADFKSTLKPHMKHCGKPLPDANRMPENHSECWNYVVISDLKKEIYERMQLHRGLSCSNNNMWDSLFVAEMYGMELVGWSVWGRDAPDHGVLRLGFLPLDELLWLYKALFLPEGAAGRVYWDWVVDEDNN